MEALRQLETKLDEMLVKNAPFQLPEGLRKWLATYAWIFVLIAFIAGLIGLLALPIIGFASILATFLGRSDVTLLLWLGALFLIVYVVLAWQAFPRLRRMEKTGWDYLYMLTLLGIAHNLLELFGVRAASLAGEIIGFIIGTLLSLYVLFQIRHYFNGSLAEKEKSN